MNKDDAVAWGIILFQGVFDIWWSLVSLFSYEDNWVRAIDSWAQTQGLGEFGRDCAWVFGIPGCHEVFNYHSGSISWAFFVAKLVIFCVGLVWLVGLVWILGTIGESYEPRLREG